MKIYLLLLSGIFILVAVSACYYDSEEYLFPQSAGQCDTSNVTYTNSVVPILQNYCLACHSNANAPTLGGNYRLQDYADVKARADDQKLYGSIAQLTGYLPMPQNSSKLDDCKIATIKKWISAGAANN